MTRHGRMERVRDGALIAFVLFAAVVTWASFRDYVFEDAYITYRYADNLAHGQGFAFNPGERILGTTTPLFTLLLAAAGVFGVDVALFGGLVFALCLGLVALLGANLLRRQGHPDLGVVYAVIVLLGAGEILRFFGMETTLYVSLLLATLLAALERRPILTGVFLGLAFLTRYDAFMLTVSLFVVLWIVEKRIPWRTYLTAAAVVVPWFVFAWAYFGSVLPHTLQAKEGVMRTSEYMYASAAVLGESLFVPLQRFGLRWPWPNIVFAAALLALVGPIVSRAGRVVRRQPLLALLLIYPLLLWLGYSAIGPPLGHRWYLVPGLHLFLLFALLCWGAALAPRSPRRWRQRRLSTVSSLILLVAAALTLPAGVAAEFDARVDNVVYRKRVGVYSLFARYIEDHGLEDLLIFTREPGYLAYQTHNPVIDGAGLVTRGIYAHGPRERQTSLAEAVAGFAPDLLLANDRELARASTQDWFYLQSKLNRSLLLAAPVFRERLPGLMRRFLEPTFEHSELSEPLGHPIHFDFEEGDEDFEASDSIKFVGRPKPLVFQGEPHASSYAHTQAPLTSSNRLESPPLKIDFDQLSFLWSASHPQSTRVEFLVNGVVVQAQYGRRSMAGELQRLTWPVHSWRGQVGRLRFVDTTSLGSFLAFDDVRSARYLDKFLFEDFESSIYAPRWKTGFGTGPRSSADLAARYGLHVILGRGSAVSLGLEGEKEVLASRSFEIRRDRLSLAVLDFGGEGTRVALRVGGETVRLFEGGDTRRPVGIDWDVAEYRGGQAVLRVVDEDGDPESWIGIDDIVFYDRAVYGSATGAGSRPPQRRRNGR